MLFKFLTDNFAEPAKYKQIIDGIETTSMTNILIFLSRCALWKILF